jgi:hypothetical protein
MQGGGLQIEAHRPAAFLHTVHEMCTISVPLTFQQAEKVRKTA